MAQDDVLRNAAREDAGKKAVLNGWLRCRRDLGGIIFIELWDKTGVTQIVFNPELNAEAHDRAGALRSEYVLAVKGTLRKRPEGTENPELATGEVELLVEDFIVLAPSKLPPFELDNADEVNEDLRMKYRYLDIRRDSMQRNLRIRHDITRYTRNYFADNGFIDIETPMLTKSTPEARATTSCRAASTPAASTRCRSRRSSSSSSSWSPAATATCR